MLRFTLIGVCLLALAASHVALGLNVEGYKTGGYSSEEYDSSAPRKADSYEENAVEYKVEYKKPQAPYEASYDEVGYDRNTFRGMFPGQCANDGLYYKDEYSFVFCSNGNAYDQRCAPGSKNSGHDRYAKGDIYYFHDFCDVNMVDDGYNLNQRYPVEGVRGFPAGYPVNHNPHVPHIRPGYDVRPSYGPGNPAPVYRGMFPGNCGNDGLYYHTEYSFMFCSNGNAFEQHCAPGSRNSGYHNYALGSGYYFHDFCDINLVDDGFNIPTGYNDKPAPVKSAY